MKKNALFLFLLPVVGAAFVFFSCAGREKSIAIVFENSFEFEREAQFVLSVCETLNAKQNEFTFGVFETTRVSAAHSSAPDIKLTFSGGWETPTAQNESSNAFLASRVWFVPRKDALENRGDTTLAACITEKTEEVISLALLEPPFTALRVDGLTADSQEYPLVNSVRGNLAPLEKPLRAPWFFGKLRAKKRLVMIQNAAALFIAFVKDAENPFIEQPPKIAWLASGGDVMLGRGALEILIKEGARGIFGETAPLLANADFAVINLEGVISTRGEKIPKSYNFRFAPAAAAALKQAGIDAVLHANNHVFDYGIEAFKDSVSFLKNAGIGVLGAGHNIAEAAAAFAPSPENMFRAYGIASFPREKNGWDGLSAAADETKAGMLHAKKNGAQKLKENFSTAALDVVFFHGGEEWSTRPDTGTRTLYRELIEGGADLIIGTHPHVVQGFEWHNGKAVFWSLGNYVFGGMDGTAGGEEGLFINLGYSGSTLVYLEPLPLTLKNNRAAAAPPERLEIFYARSKALAEETVKEEY